MSDDRPRRVYWRPEGMTREKWDAMTDAERNALVRVVAEQLIEAVRGSSSLPHHDSKRREPPS